MILFISICHSCSAQNITEAEAVKYLETAEKVYEVYDNTKLSEDQIDKLNLAIGFFSQDREQYLHQWGKCLYLRANQHYVSLNETKALEDIFRVVEALKNEGSANEHYSLAGECYNLAQIVYSELLFNLDQARAMIRFSLEQYEKAGEPYGKAETCMNGAFAMARFGRCGLAEQYFNQAITVMEQNEGENFKILPFYSKFVKGVIQLCLVGESYYNGEIDQAEAHQKLARKNFYSIVNMFPPGPEKLTIHHALGSSYITPAPAEWSNLDSAAHHFRQVMDLYLPSPHLDEYVYTLWLNIPEFFRLAREEPDKLLHFADSISRRLPISIFTPTDEDLLNTPFKKRVNYMASLTYIGLAFRHGYNNTKDIHLLEGALRVYRSFLEVAFINRFVLATNASVEAYDHRYSEVFPNAVHVALQLYEATGDEDYLEEAFNISDQSKGFTLRRHLYHAFSAPKHNPEQQVLWEKEEALRLGINKLEAEYLRTEDSLLLKQAAQQRVELWKFIHGLKDGNPVERRYYAERFKTDIPSIEDIQGLLSVEEALIEFEVSAGQSLAFVITRDDVQVVYLNGLMENIVLIDSCNHYLKINSTKFFRRSHDLYREVFEPVREKLPDTIKYLAIVPDHKYWKINFDALATNLEPTKYLLEKYVISYSYSAAILHQMVQRRENGEGEGNIGFFYGQYPKKDSLPDMENMRKEAESLVRAFPWAKAFPEVSKRKFTESLAGLRGLMLAVHGMPGEQEDISGVQLSFPMEPESPLYIQEAYGLPMKEIRFLFLAACNGAWGDFSRGEGISSIARAFHYAGCPSLIAPQMKAREDISAELMTYFFQYLNDGFNYAESLTEAKRKLLGKGRRYGQPIHWAPFLCIGDGFGHFR